ncbi:2-dehydro-3-deoxygalactonokinase [Atlantibacter subterranea]|jgi:2-dehydro-3-deoxygalactonokinase|uniref:2-dehydro-3-deoxygalactonokinase n=1 Tax=Atlantibacter subterraneus TaxID=255519 RepID=A0A427UQP5_9ENTR|nr:MULTISPECIES: 2-dehydro-3-deoxygalactonokinase [Enterobacteriaceae]MDZ5667372.1 2-dehydro-3-deoxygalactonokinase [Atlantibacter hermannii]MDA3135309.1 2-dehydro-3-deoxygalactonokinase [Atlantibacter subterranea]MDV7024205.1 2-dehydro-3-deoxygalactonokinase [Atlantibacter subterranea]MDW2744427.1 2-dehydro-3-deoxygalactonokinase [Atlantibacter subterranea]RSB60098.1 2-dehydro-3-deoxygalactonokinase [Atlantibacter subterranea]
MYIITIDTGTTNTRVCAWQDERLLAEAARPVGVRDTAISGSTETLMKGVSDAVNDARSQANIPAGEKVVYLSAGMITSNVGLCEIPHLLAPAGLNELAKGMVCANLPAITDEPIWFVPGIRNHKSAVTLENAEQMDMMRGEETEAIGVLASLGISGPALIILPGSHSKFVKIDADNRIEGCVTTIGGELLDVITRHTILASSLNLQFAQEIEAPALLQGANQCLQTGLSRTCFSVRVLDMFSDLTLNQKANVLLGAVLQDDLQAVKNSEAFTVTPDTHVVVCGKDTLKFAFATLIDNDPWFTGKITVAPSSRSLSSAGLFAMARRRQII